MSLIKGIKKGKTIELLEEIELSDGQGILVKIETSNNFWNSLEEFSSFQDVEFYEEYLGGLRDKY
ncbi:MAG: hypothetical protein AAFQ80_19770 [Cyanobacteria bacterium J06621_8]